MPVRIRQGQTEPEIPEPICELANISESLRVWPSSLSPISVRSISYAVQAVVSRPNFFMDISRRGSHGCPKLMRMQF